jgi:cytidylate kinase
MDSKSSSERLAEAMGRARRHWETSRKAEPRAAVPLHPPPVTFSVAISRQAGANGPAIARAVGTLLDWPVYDQELLRAIAGEMGVRAELLQSVDEKHRSWLQECVDALGAAPTVTQSGYVHHLAEILLALAAMGDCVIVGRGAAQVMPAATTLRVRLVGPHAERVRGIERRFGISHDEAARWVDRTDQDRVRFVRDHFHRDPTDPALYDLILNSVRFSVAECAELILDALRRFQARPASPGRLRTGAQAAGPA